MADAEVIRRREIRKRKILEQSEARLNRITSTKRNHESQENIETEETLSLVSNAKENKHKIAEDVFLPEENIQNINKTDLLLNLPESSLNFRFVSSNKPISSTSLQENSYSLSSNGASQRSKAADNYIFPKKVSDTETRSFVRSRSDVRRNSTCTQMMMETLQLSSLSLTIFRPWIAAVLGFSIQLYFLLTDKFPFFQNLLFPYVLLEIVFFTWLQFETQATSRQTTSLISGILVLYNVNPHVISSFNSILYLVQSAVQDLSVYLFSFVIFHFVCKSYM